MSDTETLPVTGNAALGLLRKHWGFAGKQVFPGTLLSCGSQKESMLGIRAGEQL